MNSLGTARRSRCIAVWVATTLGVALLLRWCAPDLPTTGDIDAPFARLLVAGAAAALALCGVWWWVVTTAVVITALRGRHRERVVGVPPVVRRLVLAACGVALVSAAQPALATPGAVHEDTRPRTRVAVIEGLPLPDRPLGGLARPAPRVPPAPDVVVVAPGDSLWTIAATRLGPAASDAEVSLYWRHIHALNRSTIGPVPDLLHPGQHLLLPRPHTHR